nr:capsid protein [Dicistroviridae sp.]
MDTADPEFSLTQATPAAPFFDTFSLSKEEEKILLDYRNRQPESRSLTEARATSGGLSGITGMIGNIASTLSGIPVIGSIASTIAPIANLASGIFSAFGFSRPNNEEPTKVVKLDPYSSHINCDNTHTTHTFGVQMLNKVEHLDGAFGSSTDDMAIAKIVRRPNLIGSFSYTTATAFRTVLFSVPVNPFMGCNMPLPDDSGSTAIPWSLTHQGFVAALFRNWLASIVFNVHVFCNSFQNSKLRFVIAPSHYTNSIAGLSIDDSNSIVVNFGINTSHQVKFPEVTNRLFLQCLTANYAQNGVPPTIPNTTNSLGTFFILLEAELRVTSDIVTPAVYGIVESFMTDSRFFEMADVPIMPARQATLRITGDDNNSERLPESRSGAYAESNLPSSSDTVAHNIVTATNLDADKNNLKAYSVCSGEAIVSLRQIATQFTSATRVPAPSPATTASDGTSLTVIRPFINLYSPFIGVDRYVDKLDYISSLYCFRRGSMHVRIMSNRLRKMLFGSMTSLPQYADGTDRYDNFLPLINNNTIVNVGRHIPVPTDLEGVMDFHIPYYQPYHCVRNTPANSVTANNNAIPHAIIIRRDAEDTLFVSRSIGDDFSYGYPISLPNFVFYRSVACIQPPPPL